MLGYLRDRGASDEQLARVHAPAGLDLGQIAHEEIAVAILAELVQERAAGNLAAASPADVPTHEAIDPVCGMTVDVASRRVPVDLRGHDLLLLLRGLPDAVRGGPGAVRGGRAGVPEMRDTRRVDAMADRRRETTDG